MQNLWAEKALTDEGWKAHVSISIADDGRISAVETDTSANGEQVGILLPAPANLHSHAFQRAMAGLTEGRGEDPTDSFWTWRKLMFSFLDHLTPDDIEAITAFVQMETLEAGYASMGEFHYIHHQPGGVKYDNLAELSGRIIAAAKETGIGLTMLPVLYEHGGCDGRELSPGQIRFGNKPDQFAKLHEAIAANLPELGKDSRWVLPHIHFVQSARKGWYLHANLRAIIPFICIWRNRLQKLRKSRQHGVCARLNGYWKTMR